MGFVSLPSTPNFNFKYDDSLNATAATALGSALAANAEADLSLVRSWFDGLMPSGAPFTVQINPRSAARSGSNDGDSLITIDLGATNDFAFARMVLVAEFIEIFMRGPNRGWNPAESHGEALSQVAGFTIVPTRASVLNGAQLWLDSNNSARPDFVNGTDSTDTNPISFGCGVLFLYYLRSQLGFSMRGIIMLRGETDESALKLSHVYGILVGDTSDGGLDSAFPEFSALLATKFPPGAPSGLAGSTNPFPIPTIRSLSLARYLAVAPLENGETIRQRVATMNIGDLRAVLNSERRFSLS